MNHLISKCHFFYLAKAWVLPALLFLYSCRHTSDTAHTLFEAIDPAISGVSFANTLTESPQQNIATYEYFYNGAGVAAGDLDGDGLPELFFTGNMVPNRLYLNRGNFQFDDITDAAGLGGKNAWATGVSMADVNGDGWLDIYVCYSGPGDAASRANELFIHQGVQDGVPVFREAAAEYGLDAPGTCTTTMLFFDMDGDGDLDAFMLNHAIEFYNLFANTSRLRRVRSPEYGNRLYRNEGGQFIDISEAAGIDGAHINFGLGVAAGDVNGDGRPDLYVTNDYNEQDFLYLNQGNGIFTEVLQQAMGHISLYSMGVDMADLNNDGLNDIVTLDMLPEDHYRQKLLRGPDGYDIYQRLVDSGFHHQQMRNMLQWNMGVHQGIPRFSEIGQLAGISNTDWSWASLAADFDGDGYKDLFVTNGYVRDFTSLDFLKYDFPQAQAAARQRGDSLPIWEAVKNLGSSPVSNYMFRNSGRLVMEDVTQAWGLHQSAVCTGAVWADLDADGAPDIVTNQTNAPAGIWRNRAATNRHHRFVTLRLQGPGANTWGFDSQIETTAGGQRQYHHLSPNKGYQSSVEPLLHIGLGEAELADTVWVRWPDGYREYFTALAAGKRHKLVYKNGFPAVAKSEVLQPQLQFETADIGLSYLHRPPQYIDFKHYPLLPHQISRQGPYAATADVNADGLEDVIITGNEHQGTLLYLQQAGGRFVAAPVQPWQPCGPIPDAGVAFIDADGDGDLDVYIAKHGNEYPEGNPLYQHRLFLNQGKGIFVPAPPNALPPMAVNSVSVSVADYNRDGKPDLFVAGRSVPGRYPVTPVSYLLKNTSVKGEVRFEYAREQPSQLLRQAGMVTCAAWADVNADGWPDLLMAGEWMPIRLFINRQGLLEEEPHAGFAGSDGLWCSLAIGDLNGDGHPDVLSGNMSPNMQMKVSPNPAILWYNDFDGNGLIDPIITYTIGEQTAPALSLDDLAGQVPSIRKQFNRYRQYAAAPYEAFFTPEKRQQARRVQAALLHSGWWKNDGKGHFTWQPLPIEAQVGPVQAIQITDCNRDGHADLILAGNYYPWRIQWGQMDAGHGWVMLGDGQGSFKPLYPHQTGFWAMGDVRDMVSLTVQGQPGWLILAYGGRAKMWQIRERSGPG